MIENVELTQPTAKPDVKPQLLFSISAEPKIERIYDFAFDDKKLAVLIGYDVWLSSHVFMSAVASAAITPYGPYVVMTRKHRPLSDSEVALVEPQK